MESLIGPDDDTPYDVILLEYSLNSAKGLELLLKRLRYRYPDAIMIYIHLYSFRKDIVGPNGLTPFQMNKYSETVSYRWGPGERAANAVYKDVTGLMRKYNGHVWALPRTGHVMNSRPLFSADWQHLSLAGHQKVAKEVEKIVEKEIVRYNPSTAKRGDWGEGDQCTSWFVEGDIPHEYSGASTVLPFEGFGGSAKYALQFKGPGKIVVENKRNLIAPIFLSFMTKGNLYPKVEVKVNNRTVMLNPTSDVNAQIMKNALVGWAMAGRNEIEITPTTGWQLPFRVVGINMCGACYFV